MYRWLIMLVLTVASATAWAQSVSPANITAKAQEVAGVAERRVATLLAQQSTLAVRYEGELRALDRLKQQKKTWNRERELKEKLSAANETGETLKRLEKNLAAAQTQLAGARRVLVAAIDAELAAKPPAERTATLSRLRGQLVPIVKRSVHRIAIPNLEVDPSADPEDLDAQAAELRQIEAELQRQVNSLDKQSKDLAKADDLRQSHKRTIQLDRQDDSTPTRNSPRNEGGRGFGDNEASPQSDGVGTGGTGGGDSPPPAGGLGDPTFESEASVVLADVVDPSTIDTLTSAQRSGDPGKRSKAAAKTRDAVKAKLDLLKQKRALIEQRAKQLRK